MKKSSNNQIIIYQTEDGQAKVNVRFTIDTVWLSQEQMAELFGKSRSTINEHIQNIYNKKELVLSEAMSKFGNLEFPIKPTNYYNLDVIISVGYRVRAPRKPLDMI